MLNHLANTDLRLSFDLKVAGEFVVPDAGDFSLTLLGDAGVPISGYNPKAVPNTGLNKVPVTIPASDNSSPSGQSFGLRFATLYFRYAGLSYAVKTNYRLIPFVPMQSTPDDVRAALGVSYAELPDADIDLYQTYLKLSQSPTFVNALQSGTVQAMYAERMIVCLEALRLSTSLQTRILKQEEEDNALYVRFSVNFDKLRADLLADYNAATGALDDLLGATVVSQTRIFSVTSPTDRVTGV